MKASNRDRVSSDPGIYFPHSVVCSCTLPVITLFPTWFPTALCWCNGVVMALIRECDVFNHSITSSSAQVRFSPLPTLWFQSCYARVGRHGVSLDNRSLNLAREAIPQPERASRGSLSRQGLSRSRVLGKRTS